MKPAALRPLHELARLWGVRLSYTDAWGKEREASPETLLAILRALGAPLERLEEAEGAVRHRRRQLAARTLGPVSVVWEGGGAGLALTLPGDGARGPAECRLELEEGETLSWDVDLGDSPVSSGVEVEGERFETLRLTVPEEAPAGYHRLWLEAGGERFLTHLFKAPASAWDDEPGRKSWGVFLPLYALHGRRSWGNGHLGDLGELVDWTAGLGGGLVSTLPLLATFLDELFQPSPYVPVSRLFWNEFFLDLEAAPGLRDCRAACSLLESAEFRAEKRRLREAELVDYARGAALQRGVLEALSRDFFGGPPGRREAFHRFLEEEPRAEDYAGFRAVCEARREPWPLWPDRLRDGRLEAGDYDEEAKRYHLYAQWLARTQLGALSDRAGEQGVRLALDLPLGVNRDGYDVWREREAFALEVSGGAPPDDFFPRGQNWGFPPIHPERSRETGHEYWAACVRNLLRHAGMLRIDHVMGLHRFFWIPEGMGPAEGAYVDYPWEELYAVLCIESHRARALLLGEDLGTVPPEVPACMERFGVRRTHVLQFGFGPDPGVPINPVPERAVSSLNTHDMFPFAAFWRGEDLDWRLEAGILDEERALEMHREREVLKASLVRFLEEEGLLAEGRTAEEEVACACLAWLGAGPAEVVQVNLEDLWGERRPQNIPGTGPERANWMGKSVYPIEQMRDNPAIVEALQILDRLRREEGERS